MTLLSVVEYANKTGKDPGNIRRLLASNRIPGRKIGKQWVIEEGTPYPADRRIRSGNYRNWRKKSVFPGDRKLARAVNTMVKDLQRIYSPYLQRIILYGSYARGNQTAESDVDIALILTSGYGKNMMNQMLRCVSDKELECDKVLSVIDIDAEKYDTWKDVLPFYKNIEKEGITLWKSA